MFLSPVQVSPGSGRHGGSFTKAFTESMSFSIGFADHGAKDGFANTGFKKPYANAHSHSVSANYKIPILRMLFNIAGHHGTNHVDLDVVLAGPVQRGFCEL